MRAQLLSAFLVAIIVLCLALAIRLLSGPIVLRFGSDEINGPQTIDQQDKPSGWVNVLYEPESLSAVVVALFTWLLWRVTVQQKRLLQQANETSVLALGEAQGANKVAERAAKAAEEATEHAHTNADAFIRSERGRLEFLPVAIRAYANNWNETLLFGFVNLGRSPLWIRKHTICLMLLKKPPPKDGGIAFPRIRYTADMFLLKPGEKITRERLVAASEKWKADFLRRWPQATVAPQKRIKGLLNAYLPKVTDKVRQDIFQRRRFLFLYGWIEYETMGKYYFQNFASLYRPRHFGFRRMGLDAYNYEIEIKTPVQGEGDAEP